MLASQEEIMMLMQQCAMQCNHGLPMLVGNPRLASRRGLLSLINVNAFRFDHGQSCVDTLDLGRQLLL